MNAENFNRLRGNEQRLCIVICEIMTKEMNKRFDRLEKLLHRAGGIDLEEESKEEEARQKQVAEIMLKALNAVTDSNVCIALEAIMGSDVYDDDKWIDRFLGLSAEEREKYETKSPTKVMRAIYGNLIDDDAEGEFDSDDPYKNLPIGPAHEFIISHILNESVFPDLCQMFVKQMDEVISEHQESLQRRTETLSLLEKLTEELFQPKST